MSELKVYTKNSMNYWFPKIENLGIPMPKTIFALHKESPFDYYGCLDGEPLPPEDEVAIALAADEVGYPLFMRSDLVSVKHEYVNTCYVRRRADLIPHLVRLIEGNALRDQPMTSIVLRKHLHLAAKFKAFRGLPIAPERRYFVVDGEVVCHHPYWPADAIHGKRTNYAGYRKPPKKWGRHTKYLKLPGNWRQLLAEMNRESPEEIELLSEYASKIGAVLGDMWSIDFALAFGPGNHSKRWYMIDAALAPDSYHDPACPVRSRCYVK